MKYTKIPEDTFKKLQLNAGVLASTFAPATGAIEDSAIIGATSGGVSFSSTPTFSDFGDDIDNCPRNTKELKVIEDYEITLSGTFVTVDKNVIKRLIGAADVSTDTNSKITPRMDLNDSDFSDLWWIGDYSEDNSESTGGFIAIHMMNTLSTGGFAIKSNDSGKGTFDFTFTSHYSLTAQDTVPLEIYIKEAA